MVFGIDDILVIVWCHAMTWRPGAKNLEEADNEGMPFILGIYEGIKEAFYEFPAGFHFHFSISRLPKNQVTQPPAIIKNQVGIDTSATIWRMAHTINAPPNMMANHCLTHALESLIGLYQHSQGIGDWLVSLLIVSG